MGQAARNALKGYTYQNYILTLFLSIMDVERNIHTIESESKTDGNFDDLYIQSELDYRVQVKNYQNVTLDDLKVSDEYVQIKGNSNKYNKTENNILIINTSEVKTDCTFMGLPAVVVDGITIIPLTPEDVRTRLDNMFSTESREIQIIQFTYINTTGSKFVINVDELPDVIRISTKLVDETILVRKPIDSIEKGILWIKGKPGVGKSHYVDELIEKYHDAIVYRFWIDSQDERLVKRLQFNTFLDDIALGVFNSPKSYTVQELVKTLISDNKILIIDGLDHVENYNPKELNLFLEFISSLVDVRTIVLSRPLSAKIDWEFKELSNWSFDQTSLYLSMSHDINEYSVIKKIYDITDGYPIITHFIAEHYKLHKEFDITTEIHNLNEYYDMLIEKMKPRSLVTVFATNNSFFTLNEIEKILGNSILYDAINEFMEMYPYIFERRLNRVSLIHDSFNTYLRSNMENYTDIKNQVSHIVEQSLHNDEIDFMARLSSFELSEDCYDKLLIQYSNFDQYKKILCSTLDYNSITSLYNQLQKLLEQRKDVLDIYQYYSFSLIYQIVNRNDLIGYDGLVYQLLQYLNINREIEKVIFSSGVIWNTFLLLKTKNNAAYAKYLSDRLYDSNQINELYNTIKKEANYYEDRTKKSDYNETLSLLNDKKIFSFTKQDVLIAHMVRVWTNNEKDDNYYSILNEFLSGNKDNAILRLKLELQYSDIETRWASRILFSAKYQLYEIGDLRETNIFYGKSLKELIFEYAPKGSFETANLVLSYIRLANHENRKIDIESINLLWAMYYNRKDYSIYTLYKALYIFENHNSMKEMDSIEIICKAMNQSEKGIRHLLSSYFNIKDSSLISRLDQNRLLDELISNFDVFELSPERINFVPQRIITNRISEVLKYYSYGRQIEYYEIANVLKSKYEEKVLEAIQRYNYKIFGLPEDNNLEERLQKISIQYLKEKVEEKKEYQPFEHGNIHEVDFSYIMSKGISYLEVAKYTDGWYSCLPFVGVYKHYEITEIQTNYLEVIHDSVFARSSDREFIGNWNLLLGNIPQFLDLYQIDIDWKRLFSIFNIFLSESLINNFDD